VHDKQVRRRRAVLALLVVASLVLLTDYFGGSPGSPLHAVQRGVVEVLSPIQSGASTVLTPVRDVAGWFSSTLKAKSENDALRRSNARLEQLVAELEYENSQDRQYARLARLDDTTGVGSYRPVTTSVIGQNPTLWYEQIEVGAGSDQGVRIGDPVVGSPATGNAGLVGEVTLVTSSSSVVTELDDPKFAVGAEVLLGSSGGDSGILEPAVGSPNQLILESLPANATQIVSGDVVVTDGFSDSSNPLIHSFAPPGIPIGVVGNVNENTLLNNQEVDVQPDVNLRHLTVVQILTKPYTGKTAVASSAGLGRGTASASLGVP
jgi:rod shape-determining protein MreC